MSRRSPLAQGEIPELTPYDAISYLDQIKHKFRHEPNSYRHFLYIMNEFKRHYIDADEVIKRVNSLFRDHPDLIMGFLMFLPSGYKA